MSTSAHTSNDTLTVVAIVITTLGALLAGLYLSGAANDFFDFVAEKYFKAEAKAEASVLEKLGEGKAEGFLEDQLKKNPVVSNEELNGISGGLGDEAAREFGKEGGMGAGIGRAFGQ